MGQMVVGEDIAARIEMEPKVRITGENGGKIPFNNDENNKQKQIGRRKDVTGLIQPLFKGVGFQGETTVLICSKCRLGSDSTRIFERVWFSSALRLGRSSCSSRTATCG